MRPQPSPHGGDRAAARTAGGKTFCISSTAPAGGHRTMPGQVDVANPTGDAEWRRHQSRPGRWTLDRDGPSLPRRPGHRTSQVMTGPPLRPPIVVSHRCKAFPGTSAAPPQACRIACGVQGVSRATDPGHQPTQRRRLPEPRYRTARRRRPTRGPGEAAACAVSQSGRPASRAERRTDRGMVCVPRRTLDRGGRYRRVTWTNARTRSALLQMT
jgi:hypothetical protein